MVHRIRIVFLALMVVALPSVLFAAEDPVQTVRDYVNVMEKLSSTLSGINQASQVKAALPKVEQMISQANVLSRKMNTGSPQSLDPATAQLVAREMSRLQEANQKFSVQLQRLIKDQVMGPLLYPALSKLGK